MLKERSKESDVNSIIAGVTRCIIGNTIYLVHEPSLVDKLAAEQVYLNRYLEARFLGVMTHDEILSKLIELRLWSSEFQLELDALPKKIEDMKYGLFMAYDKFQKRDHLKKALNNTKKRVLELLVKRECLKRESAEGIALLCKNRFLICASTTDAYGNRLWDSNNYGSQDTKLVDALLREYVASKHNDETIRYLARTEPWRTIWGVSKATNNIFGVPAVNLTDEQKSLIWWSRLYDSVYESTERPDTEVLNDDDMLDGWMIHQHKKGEELRNQGEGDNKKPGHKEVFLFADTEEDAARIYRMNDSNSRSILRQRMATIQKHGGKVSETHMPDAQIAMREQAMRAMSEHVQRRG